MKKALLWVALFFPQFISGQHIVQLFLTQPPEFGFSLSRQDTTITKGSYLLMANDLIVKGGSGSYTYKWTPVTALSDPSDLHPIASPQDTTNYIITVTDKNGCSFSLVYTVNVKTQLVSSDLTSNRQNLQVIIFPNPNEGFFKVKLTGTPSEKIELEIMDTSGKVLKKQTIKNFKGEYTEDLQLYLSNGIYMLRINSALESLCRQFVIN